MAQEQIKEARKSYHHGDLKGALIRATQQLIEEKGIDHFSVSDACRLAGVSTAAPYKHFKSKDEMVVAGVCDAMARHAAELQTDLAPHLKGSQDRIVAMGANYVDYALREPGMFRLRFAHFEGEPPEAIQMSGEAIYGLVQEEVRAYLGEPEINERVRDRAYLLWCVVHGMSYLSMVPEFASKRPLGSPEDYLRRMSDVVLAR
ncbi:MAG: TetR/AcrR family transcriptional regulator [Pseudomonadota bacterium]